MCLNASYGGELSFHCTEYKLWIFIIWWFDQLAFYKRKSIQIKVGFHFRQDHKHHVERQRAINKYFCCWYKRFESMESLPPLCLRLLMSINLIDWSYLLVFTNLHKHTQNNKIKHRTHFGVASQINWKSVNLQQNKM